MKERQSASWCFYFRYPITVKKYIMAARMQAVARHRRPFFCYSGNEYYLDVSVCYLPNK